MVLYTYVYGQLYSATNISICHILMIMPQVLHIFAPYSP